MEIPDKALFRIGEVAKLLGVQTHVVRFWQSQFPSLQPGRTSTGRFLYTRSQVEQLERIRQLLHVERLTIEGAKKALRSGKANVILRPRGDAPDPSPAALAIVGEGHDPASPGDDAASNAAPSQADGLRTSSAAAATVDRTTIEAVRLAIRALRREVEVLQERLEEI